MSESSEIKLIEPGESHESLDQRTAMEVGSMLAKKYPGHPWMVKFQGGVINVSHWEIYRERPGFVYTIKHRDIRSAAELAHATMIAGGQLLEAFKLKRGSWDGREIQGPDGWRTKDPRSFN